MVFSAFRRGSSPEHAYNLLPLAEADSATARTISSVSHHTSRVRIFCHLFSFRRPLRVCLALLCVVFTVGIAAGAVAYNYPLPPLYSRFHESEVALTQHNAALPAPEGAQGKYLWIANHASKCGWGNTMQELFLNAYLAYRSGRAFVFDNYTWSHDPREYSLYNLKPIPSRIPLSAMIRGPIVGAYFPNDTGIPRAVIPEYFYQVCEERTIIGSFEGIHRDGTAGVLIQDWILKLAPHRCVEVPRGLPELFDEHLFANADRLLDIWPHFSQSPIVQGFSWSTLVELAFDTNRHIIAPASVFAPTLSSHPAPGLARYTPISGLLVLHIRRGDFRSHCTDVLAARALGYTAYNSFPALPDRWSLPADLSQHEKLALYTRHCFPEIKAIVERVEEVRKADGAAELRQVYIMTNGSPGWVAQLKRALLKRHPWEHVASNRELVLTPEQKGVAQAVDMLVAQRAQVFVGNGFSTLSGMVVMLRMANGMDPATMRHW